MGEAILAMCVYLCMFNEAFVGGVVLAGLYSAEHLATALVAVYVGG